MLTKLTTLEVMKVPSSKKTNKSQIPGLASYEEEAVWWDTHELADLQDEFKTVSVSFAKHLSHDLVVPLDPEGFRDLLAQARLKGVSPATLAKTWILEHLGNVH